MSLTNIYLPVTISINETEQFYHLQGPCPAPEQFPLLGFKEPVIFLSLYIKISDRQSKVS